MEYTDTQTLAVDLLDLVKDKNHLDTDYQLAAHMGIPLQTIRNYRLGKTIPNATACLQLSEELKEDPLRVMAKFKILAAKNDRERGVWARYAGRVLLVAIALAGLPDTGNAQNVVKPIDQDIHYAHIFRMICAKIAFLMSQIALIFSEASRCEPHKKRITICDLQSPKNATLSPT